MQKIKQYGFGGFALYTVLRVANLAVVYLVMILFNLDIRVVMAYFGIESAAEDEEDQTSFYLHAFFAALAVTRLMMPLQIFLTVVLLPRFLKKTAD